MPSAKYYAVARGKVVGVFGSWGEAQPLVNGYANARYKAFATRAEAEAFVSDNSAAPSSSVHQYSSPHQHAPSTSSAGRPVEKVYAVARGAVPGVYRTWGEAQPLVAGIHNARYKSFATVAEAQAFVDAESNGTNYANSLAAAAVRDEVKATSARDQHFSASSRYLSSGSNTEEAAPPIQSDHRMPPPLVAYTDGACPNNGTVSARAGYGVHYPSKDNKANLPVPKDVSKPVPSAMPQTNNVGELMAVVAAVRNITERDRTLRPGDNEQALAARRRQPLVIYADSQYCINGATKWLKGWAAKGYERKATSSTSGEGSLKNADLWRELDQLMAERKEQMEMALTSAQEETKRSRGSKSVREDDSVSPAEAKRLSEKMAVQFVHVRGHCGNSGNEMADQLAVRGALGK